MSFLDAIDNFDPEYFFGQYTDTVVNAVVALEQPSQGENTFDPSVLRSMIETHGKILGHLVEEEAEDSLGRPYKDDRVDIGEGYKVYTELLKKFYLKQGYFAKTPEAAEEYATQSIIIEMDWDKVCASKKLMARIASAVVSREKIFSEQLQKYMEKRKAAENKA